MQNLKWIIPVAALEAAATGLVLIVSPYFFAWLVLGSEPSDLGQALGRIAGIAMLGLGLASWSTPGSANASASGIRALLIYNLLATVYLGYVGIIGQFVGILLWPAVALHAILAVLVARVLLF